MEHESHDDDIERRLARALGGRDDQAPAGLARGARGRASALRRRRAAAVSGVAALAVVLPVSLGIDSLQSRGEPQQVASAPSVSATAEPEDADVPEEADVPSSSAEPSTSSEPTTTPGVQPLERVDGQVVLPAAVGLGAESAVPGLQYFRFDPNQVDAYLQNVVPACTEGLPQEQGLVTRGGGTTQYTFGDGTQGYEGEAYLRVQLFEDDGAFQSAQATSMRAYDCAEVMDLEVLGILGAEEESLFELGTAGVNSFVVVGATPAEVAFEVDQPDLVTALAVTTVDDVELRALVKRAGTGGGPEAREQVRSEAVALLTAGATAYVEQDVAGRLAVTP